uniref:Uncharacterized protein n=1 Tax=Tanacetum cinerariifolium TaxID=118510 RepID=A0A699J747_TANCI|nr:hypothetical protein [Tanacetum cinerariifolium]
MVVPVEMCNCGDVGGCHGGVAAAIGGGLDLAGCGAKNDERRGGLYKDVLLGRATFIFGLTGLIGVSTLSVVGLSAAFTNLTAGLDKMLSDAPVSDAEGLLFWR